MKKIFTLLTFLMLGTVIYAQSYYVFTDKDGNVIEKGKTIECTEIEDTGFDLVMKSGLFVKNVDAPSNYQVAVVAKITRIDNGAIQLCFPMNCFYYDTVGTHGGTTKASLSQGASQDILSEWIPKNFGECVVEYTAKSYQGAFPKADYTVTVHYKYADPAGIELVKGGQSASIRHCYDLLGRQTTGVQHGLNIIRMSDGSVRKVFK